MDSNKMEEKEGNSILNGIAHEVDTQNMSGARSETDDSTKERNQCCNHSAVLEALTKNVKRLEDEVEMLKKQAKEVKVSGNDPQLNRAFPREPETENSLLEKAKLRCVALYRKDKYVALGFYMAAMPSYLVTAGEPFNYNGEGDKDVRIWRFGLGFDEKSYIVQLGYPETNMALLPIDYFILSKLVKQGGYGSGGLHPHWTDSLSFDDGERATIFGLIGTELEAKSGEVVQERPAGKYGIISCSLGPAALGSPVVDGKGVVIGVVIKDIGRTTRFLTSGGICDWMRRSFANFRQVDHTGHSGKGGGWGIRDDSVDRFPVLF